MNLLLEIDMKNTCVLLFKITLSFIVLRFIIIECPNFMISSFCIIFYIYLIVKIEINFKIKNIFFIKKSTRGLKRILHIQRNAICEFITGLFLLLLLWLYFKNYIKTANLEEEISLIKALCWCLKPQPLLDFTIIFVGISMLVIITISIITSLAEIFSSTAKITINWILVVSYSNYMEVKENNAILRKDKIRLGKII